MDTQLDGQMTVEECIAEAEQEKHKGFDCDEEWAYLEERRKQRRDEWYAEQDEATPLYGGYN